MSDTENAKTPQAPQAAVIEIIDKGRASTDTIGGSMTVPCELRINGQPVLTQGPIQFPETISLGNDKNVVAITLTIIARRVVIAAEGDLDDWVGKGIACPDCGQRKDASVPLCDTCQAGARHHSLHNASDTANAGPSETPVEPDSQTADGKPDGWEPRPPCMATISNATTDGTVACVFRYPHRDAHGGPKHPVGGRLRWTDDADGATTHHEGKEQA